MTKTQDPHRPVHSVCITVDASDSDALKELRKMEGMVFTRMIILRMLPDGRFRLDLTFSEKETP